jgi:hypothetical protein
MPCSIASMTMSGVLMGAKSVCRMTNACCLFSRASGVSQESICCTHHDYDSWDKVGISHEIIGSDGLYLQDYAEASLA